MGTSDVYFASYSTFSSCCKKDTKSYFLPTLIKTMKEFIHYKYIDTTRETEEVRQRHERDNVTRYTRLLAEEIKGILSQLTNMCSLSTFQT
jgi:hypothetical protein